MQNEWTDMLNDQIDILNGIGHVPLLLLTVDALVAGTETTEVCVEADHVLAHHHQFLYNNNPEVTHTTHGNQLKLTWSLCHKDLPHHHQKWIGGVRKSLHPGPSIIQVSCTISSLLCCVFTSLYCMCVMLCNFYVYILFSKACMCIFL